MEEVSPCRRERSPNDTWRHAMSVKPGQSANKSQARWILCLYFRWKRRYAIAKAQYVCNILPLMCGSPVKSGSSANQTGGKSHRCHEEALYRGKQKRRGKHTVRSPRTGKYYDAVANNPEGNS